MEEELDLKENYSFDRIKISSKDWRKTLMYNEITHVPHSLSQKDFEHLRKNNSFVISDIYYSFKKNTFWLNLICGSILLIVSALFLYWSTKNYAVLYWESLILPGIFGILGLLMISIELSKEKTGFILHRQTGLLSYPNGWWNKPVIVKFKNSNIRLSILGKSLALKAIRPGVMNGYYILSTFHPLNFWSFMVWYMDKNRPLPPGDAFDEFRERDFQRRKAEGFPPPLYPSYVPTPEATPEQQAERDQYWEERFTVDQSGETLRHLWICDDHLRENRNK